ncbi:hypothetical protein LEM8419_02167 [Neolewinella maritima]|uniref:DinB-like domain-containing protein n=1 Tax=Neolewinella maritima TaxID=1383882 RepID=A0ABM9B1Q2_9BACT|nr:DinB family protein [Neolewinella maritima]CAH1001267.1 hypothetical protein LEM8419_02167 [Neolewinella maritima]
MDIPSTDYFRTLYDTLHGDRPWYGTGVEESLAAIPEADLHARVGHRSITQLLGHMLAWRHDLIRRLHKLPRERIELNSPQDWPDATGRTKVDFLREFAETKQLLQEGLAAFDTTKLHDKLHPDHPYTNVQLLEGGVLHDVYHLGQINLIAALLNGQRAAATP